ncbi:hypothetical protein WJX73_008670 [Symbiochloris irregularis]|uniref:PB1 domain-containing protein n=1 Tax=Symbiochloris irregularis TaxID=706552 RepID=A0AAW1PWK3_9CHLO
MAKTNHGGGGKQPSTKAKAAPTKAKSKKEKDAFDWRADRKAPVPTPEPKPLSGGFKSMKNKWLSAYQEDLQAKRSAAQAEAPAQSTVTTGRRDNNIQAQANDHNRSLASPVPAVEGRADVAKIEQSGANNRAATAPASAPASPTRSHKVAHGTKAELKAEAKADAAAAVARKQAEAELAQAAETRAKQHVDASTAKEGPAMTDTSSTAQGPPASAAEDSASNPHESQVVAARGSQHAHQPAAQAPPPDSGAQRPSDTAMKPPLPKLPKQQTAATADRAAAGDERKLFDAKTGTCKSLGRLNLLKISDYRHLSSRIEKITTKGGPSLAGAKLAYEDTQGDLLLLQPDEDWSSMVSSASRLLVCPR